MRPGSASTGGKRSRRGEKRKKVTGFVLTVIDGQLSGREYHFETEATVGRIDDNEVIMVDPGISRTHARFYGKRGVYLVEDLQSSNGTRLNGEMIDGPEVLRDGDYVGVGQATLQFSNLEMGRSGEDTVRMRLTAKQARKLDHPGSQASPREQLLALWATPRGKLLAGAGVLAVLLLGAGLIKQCAGGKKHRRGSRRELSGQPVDYDSYQAQGYRTWSFGYGAYNRNYRDKVTFRYVKPPQKLRVTLQYAAWGIDDPEEVVILINKKRVGTVPATRRITIQGKTRYEYDYGLRLDLDVGALKTGENLITFDNTKNDRHGTDMWEICYLKIKERAIPRPDLAKAKECFFNAKNAYEQRKVHPANMQKAIKDYECARDYLEDLPNKPPDYAVSIRQIALINKELSRLFKTAIFDAQRHYRYKEWDKARSRLKQTMMYFQANPRDPRYLQLGMALERLGQ